MELLPAIDLRQGRVVRLRRGDDAERTVYSERPTEVAAGYARGGARWVHVVDLDAAFGEAPQRDLLVDLAGGLAEGRGRGSVGVQLGGGLRSEESVTWALETVGCDRAVVGSLVGRDFRTFVRLTERFPGRIVPALDVAGDEVRIAGWREAAGRSLETFCRELRGLPCPAVLVTDVERDGTLDGPNLELARRVAECSGVPALLSGGVRSIGDLEAARQASEMGGEIGGAVVGTALYEGVFTVEEALAVLGGDGIWEAHS